ncbi:hypothetical protein [Microbacterium luticocti]|uniref:hypothetical protein n=1 Tax=Microbacterium luticocti TaxID=451764 RepID=UPI00041B443A|nr:hypothetical protein [Microbacterium luticocti]
MRAPRLTVFVLSLCAAAAVLAGCGATGGPRTVLTVTHTAAGDVVADASGRAVYLYTSDRQGADRSSCDTACRAAWPPVTTTSTDPQAPGVDAPVGEIPDAGGGYQVTLDGWPLYYFDGDTGPGMIKGQGVGGVWWLLAPDGTRVSAIGR